VNKITITNRGYGYISLTRRFGWLRGVRPVPIRWFQVGSTTGPE